MLITAQRLAQLAPGANRDLIAVLAPIMNTALPAAGISSTLRVAHFMGQMAHESSGFSTLKESLNYRDPARLDAMFSAVKGVADAKALIAKGQEAIANRVYGGRMGNGPEASGDGWRYRGRGIVQITGKENYQRFGKIAGLDLVNNPDLAMDPKNAVDIAIAYWTHHNLNALADKDDCEGITRKINGGLNGLAHRAQLTTDAKRIFV